MAIVLREGPVGLPRGADAPAEARAAIQPMTTLEAHSPALAEGIPSVPAPVHRGEQAHLATPVEQTRAGMKRNRRLVEAATAVVGPEDRGPDSQPCRIRTEALERKGMLILAGAAQAQPDSR